MNSANPRIRTRNDWKRQLTPLLDSLMNELCQCQRAIVSRDLELLASSVSRQMQLADNIMAENRALLASRRERMGESSSSGKLEPELMPLPPRLPLPGEPAHLDPEGAQFQAAAINVRQQARVSSALLRRSSKTMTALSNLFALDADTYQRPPRTPDAMTKAMPEPRQPEARSAAEGG